MMTMLSVEYGKLEDVVELIPYLHSSLLKHVKGTWIWILQTPISGAEIGRMRFWDDLAPGRQRVYVYIAE